MKDSVWSFVIVLCFSHIHIITGFEESSLVIWVERGNDTILYCNLGGTEESFDWTRGQNYTDSTQNLLAYNNNGVIRGECLTQGKCELFGRNLKLKKAQITDEDTYYCGTPKSYTSVILKVTIEPSAPNINHCSESTECAIIFPVGFSLYLTCVIRGSRPAAELTWSSSTHKVMNGTKTSVYTNQDGTYDTVSFLQIKHNAPTVYTCEAHGPSMRQSWKSRATINVTEAINPDNLDVLQPISKHPEINYCELQQPNCSLTWPIGLPLQLKCTLRGVQRPLELFWWHPEHDLSKNTTTEIHPSSNGAFAYVSTVTLHISRSSAYNCVAGKDGSLFGDRTTSVIYITSTDVFPLHSKNENVEKDGWMIPTIISISLLLLGILFGLFILYIFLKRKKCCQKVITGDEKGDPVESQENTERKVANELQSYNNEAEKMLNHGRPVAQEAVQEDSVAADQPGESYPLLLRDSTSPNKESTYAKESESGDSTSPNKESTIAKESESGENVSKGQDETDFRLTPERSKEFSQVHPTDIDTSRSTNEEVSVIETDTRSGEEGTLQRISSEATYPVKEETNSEVTTTESTSSSSSDGIATLETETNIEKLSSPKFKGHFITPKLIRDKRCSCNFSLEDEKSDILLKFSMKGYGLIISFVPCLELCDEGYMIHFQENGEIIFSKHGMKIDLDGNKNRYDPSKRLNFILNTASKKVLLLEEDGNNKKPLLVYTPVQTAICSYLVIGANENSQFDMVLFPIR